MEAVFPEELKKLLELGQKEQAKRKKEADHQYQIWLKGNKRQWNQFYDKVKQILVSHELGAYIVQEDFRREFHQPRYVSFDVPGCAPIRVEIFKQNGDFAIRENNICVAMNFGIDEENGGFYLSYSNFKAFTMFSEALACARERYLEAEEYYKANYGPKQEPVYVPMEEGQISPVVADIFSKPVLADLADMIRDIVREELDN